MGCGWLWLLLALLAGLWAQPGRAGHCQDGQLRLGWGGGTKCCPNCSWELGNPEPCEAARDPDCKCPRGYSCADEACQFCRELPRCELGWEPSRSGNLGMGMGSGVGMGQALPVLPGAAAFCQELLRCEPGWEPSRIGTVNFQFGCKPCRNGSYSSSRNSWCRNWTDCESSGFIMLWAGNSTHNSVCSLPVRALEPARIPLEFSSGSVLAVLAAAAVFVLVLLTVLLHFCIWSLRRDKTFPAGDPGHNFPQASPQLPLQGEESHSIQFPEEEHGDKTAEEKLSILSLKIYSELS
ncbi:PREDICTED: tumor necrosis factor receptor superfamily member 18 [Pseudopodoces humilis]|uniref:tumor necrosis factor receptor superfamily member 18 n=1 Tax=Pseudopodoces humilis TaxID=181119 RepID=UPI0006B719E3|nr:PREDICTED: tumor necrosis factor receptor superfamily member 18 [Pseudopodoces humilis]